MKRGCCIFVLVIGTLFSGCAANQEQPYQYSEKVKTPPPEPQDQPQKPTIAELEASVVKQSNEILDRQFYFKYLEDAVSAQFKDLGIKVNSEEVVKKVRQQGKVGSDLELPITLDEKVLTEKIKALTSKYNSQPKDATFKLKANNTMEVAADSVGKEVDIAKAVADFKQAMSNKETEITLEVKEIAPKIKKETLEAQKLEGLVASFSTNYAVSNKPRSENLQKAAKTIDMKLLKPGEVFSFNTAVGPRTAETGYQEALIIIDNEYVPGVGGGICQVSSTLYNAALLADLEIVERHRHEFVIPYLPPGRDATVVYDQADLRFKNNTPGFLLIRAEAKGGILKMSMFGKKTNKRVEIKTEIEETKPFETEQRLDATLPPGKSKQEQAGVKGYKSITYRIVKIDNKEVRRDELSKDVYKPANKIIKVGPRKSRGVTID